jgi:trans-aconitate methyltransferase
VHDAVLQAAMLHPALQRVVDLGCGQGNEFFHYGKPALYVGLDQNATPIHEARRIRLKADYRDVNFIKEIVEKYALRSLAKITYPFTLSGAGCNSTPHGTSPA